MDEERGSNYKREERLPWLDVEPLIKDSDMLGLVIAISTVQTAQATDGVHLALLNVEAVVSVSSARIVLVRFSTAMDTCLHPRTITTLTTYTSMRLRCVKPFAVASKRSPLETIRIHNIIFFLYSLRASRISVGSPCTDFRMPVW